MGIPRFLTRRSFALLAMALAAPLIAPLFAQEGHPLKGSWIGVWESNSVHGDDIIVIMNWDGKAISGTINPGTDNMVISNARLDPNGWKVHLEADGKDSKGAAVHYVIDGAIQKLEMTDRFISGTWTSQRGKGKFEIHRQ